MRVIGRISLALLLIIAACKDGGSPSSPTNTPTLKQRMTTNVAGIGQAGTNFYQVFVTNLPGPGIGDYTVMTGPNHPVTISQRMTKNVLFGDGLPATSYESFHSYTSNTTYVTALMVPPGASVIQLSPTVPGIAAHVEAIGTTGFRTTWTLAGPPQTPDKMTIVEVVDTHGTTFETSTVEVTTSITNNGTAPLAIGVRYLWDTQIGDDDGPTFQQFSPDAPAIVFEKSFPNPSFQFYRIQDNDGNSPTPLFSVFGTVSGPSSVNPAPTPPDLIENADWTLSVTSPFSYTADPTRDVSTINSGNDNAVLYFWGSTQANAVSIAANATKSFSQSLVSAQADAPPPFNQSPTATITAPANNASFVQGASVSFTGTGTDPEDGALTGASLVWSSSRDGQIGTGASFSTSTLSVGTHTITLTVTDSQGAHGTATITVIITGPVVDQHPTATITSPTNGATFVQGASVSFAGSGSDPEDGPVTGSALRWSSDRDGPLTTGATFSRSNLSVGTHVITLTAVDSKGQTGTATVTIHITAPAQNQPPTAHITAPASGAIFTPGASISFAGSGSDPEDGALSGASLVWTDNVSGQIGTGASFSVTTLAAGLHTVTLTATDSKGAKGTATISFTVAFSQVIGAAGGSLCVEACHLSLFIPAGALSSSFTFVEYPVANPPGAPAGLVGSAHVIAPSVTFATDGALGIGYDPLTLPTGISEGTLRIYQLVGGSWQLIPNSNVNMTSHIVYAQVGGTGTFAVVGTP
ncbi:MAG: hypothetical protein M3Y30_09990 [Gemmatimonadota bacterium]|nr:hypothetical protein [Gemmatimonadota bacterium]